jgi:hypothetical protein
MAKRRAKQGSAEFKLCHAKKKIPETIRFLRSVFTVHPHQPVIRASAAGTRFTQ